jgi:hypothetical protein
MGSKGFENDRVVGRELIEDVPIHCKIAENLPGYLAQDKRPFRRPPMVAALTSVAVVIRHDYTNLKFRRVSWRDGDVSLTLLSCLNASANTPRSISKPLQAPQRGLADPLAAVKQSEKAGRGAVW